MSDPTESFRKLFCGGLSSNTTKETLLEYFQKFGKISDCVVMKDRVTGRSKCFGFVTFEDANSVDSAQSCRPHTLDEKQIDTKRAIPRDDPSPESRYISYKIFVGGLKKDVTKEQIKKYFENYGTVTEVNLPMDNQSGHARGFCFVTFADTDSVDKVIIYKPHNISSCLINVRKAISRKEMDELKSMELSQQSFQSQQYNEPSQSWNAYDGGYEVVYFNEEPTVSGWGDFYQEYYDPYAETIDWNVAHNGFQGQDYYQRHSNGSNFGIFKGAAGPMRQRRRGRASNYRGRGRTSGAIPY